MTNKNTLTLSEAIEPFLSHRKRSVFTVDKLRYALTSAFVKLGAERPVTAITAPDLAKFMEQRASGDLSEWSLATDARNLRTFFSWCVEIGLIDHSPAAGISVPQYRPLPLEALAMSNDDIERLLSYARSAHARTYAIVALFIGTGCRRNECAELRMSDIDHVHQIVTLRGKGMKRRTVPLLWWVQSALEAWMAERPAAPHDYVFSSLLSPHNSLSYRGLATFWRRLVKRAGLAGRRTNMHAVRHWFASQLARSGANMTYIQELLGHADIQTTRLYVHASIEDLRTAMNEAFK